MFEVSSIVLGGTVIGADFPRSDLDVGGDMLTVCWAAKGGSGTTVVAAAIALSSAAPTVLVDLAGDLPLVLGVDADGRPGVHDWLTSGAPADRLDRLAVPLGSTRTLVPRGEAALPVDDARWAALGRALATRPDRVIVDAGTGDPPPALCAAADALLIVTRPCYVGLRRAIASTCRPTGVVLVDEPGHRLSADDVERSLGVPVVATVLLDPAIARAVDSGLLVSRLPRACTTQLGRVAA